MNLSTSGLKLAPDSLVDLHLHTTYSDGRWTLEPLFDHLLRQRFALAAVTDHDRTDTTAAVQQMALEKGLPVLVGVEMSTTWQGEMTDLLCYGFEPGPHPLSDLALDLFHRQQENTRSVFDTLLSLGYTFTPDALPSLLADPSSVQPLALAALLRKHGYGLREPSAGQIVQAAGAEFAFNHPADVVEAAHRSGAVCLLAHPGRGNGYTYFDAPLLDQFRREAPIDGIEVYYPLHTPSQAELYLEYAENNNLLTSAGSDSHGPEKPPIPYRAESCRALLERLGVV